MTIKQLAKQIEKSKAQIAKERDKLRELVDEADSLLNDWEQAEDSLQTAIDTLSQLV